MISEFLDLPLQLIAPSHYSLLEGVLSIEDGTDYYCARGDFSHINALSDVIIVSLFLGVAEVILGSGCFRIAIPDRNRLLKWVLSIEDGTTEHSACGDFPYLSALRHFSGDVISVSRFLMYKRFKFPWHFTDLGMPYRVHSWGTIFRDVDVFLALMSSTYLRPSLLSHWLRRQRLIFCVHF